MEDWKLKKMQWKEIGKGEKDKTDKLMDAGSSGYLESEMIIIIFYKILRNVTMNHHLS